MMFQNHSQLLSHGVVSQQLWIGLKKQKTKTFILYGIVKRLVISLQSGSHQMDVLINLNMWKAMLLIGVCLKC